jgi:hypothetical protein
VETMSFQGTFMKKYAVFTLLFIILFSSLVLAQKQPTGRVLGKIVDGETGEPLIGVNVLLENTMMGSATDLDGNYAINNVPINTYNLVATYIGYSRVKIENVVVRSNQVTMLNFSMTMEAIQGEEVIVTAKAIRNNETVRKRRR